MTGEIPVRCGIIGLGNIGYSHADSLDTIDTAQLVGGMDVAADARRAFESVYDVPTFESIDALITHGIDALIICTPNRFHEEYAVDALNADVPVLCEKPLAHTLESAKRILDADESSNAFCMVGFNYRYTAPALDIVASRDEGVLGDITHIDAKYIRRRGVPGRGGWFTQEQLAGGGSLIDLGVHAIDLALHIADNPEVVEVLGTTRSEFGGRENYTYTKMHGDDHGHENFDVDDSVNAFIQCAGDLTINIDVAWASNRPPSQEFIVRGTESGASFNLNGDTATYYHVNRGEDAEDPLPTVESAATLDDHDSRATEQQAFVECVADGESPTWNTSEQAYNVQQVIEAIYRSSESGHAVTLQ